MTDDLPADLQRFADLMAPDARARFTAAVQAHGQAAAATALNRAADAADAVFRAGDSDEGETWAKWLRIRAAEAGR
jgi:propanediol dehydratase large subunit